MIRLFIGTALAISLVACASRATYPTPDGPIEVRGFMGAPPALYAESHGDDLFLFIGPTPVGKDGLRIASQASGEAVWRFSAEADAGQESLRFWTGAVGAATGFAAGLLAAP